jgi:hypothetical protein
MTMPMAQSRGAGEVSHSGDVERCRGRCLRHTLGALGSEGEDADLAVLGARGGDDGG